MERLVCFYPILFENRHYIPSEELPTHNARYVDAWIDNGAAKWTEDFALEKPLKSKARLVTAESGLVGINSTDGKEGLVGKVPPRNQRGIQQEKEKRGKKSSD